MILGLEKNVNKMEIMVKEKYSGKTSMSFEYYNEKKLGVNDFLDSIKEDLLKHISNIRVFIDENYELYEYYNDFGYDEDSEGVEFGIWHDDNEEYFYFSISGIMGLYLDGISNNEFVSDLIYFANREKDDKMKYNINNFIIDSIWISINVNADKLKHKHKFYKKLYDELMAVAWHPSRYLDWCIDVEELRHLKKLWGEED